MSNEATDAAWEALKTIMPLCGCGQRLQPGALPYPGVPTLVCTNCSLVTVPDPEWVKAMGRAAMKVAVDPALHCLECTIDDDPISWCDCEHGQTCRGPCRWRAHSPKNCPWEPNG